MRLLTDLSGLGHEGADRASSLRRVWPPAWREIHDLDEARE